jgi:tetratricopeptide (TPR) repeat protein
MPRCLSCGRRGCRVHAPGATPVPRPGGDGVRPPPAVPGWRAAGLLGRGGFGTVIEAVSEVTGARAAVKVARADVPDAAAQLARETAALRAVGPPATPALLETGSLPDGTPFVALELLEGPSLASRLAAAAGPLPAGELAATAGSVLDALAAVHAAGFAHGDLKPENVILQGSPPRARLLDFGLSERLGSAPGARADTLAGTAEYMAPEQCQGFPPDARTDVYAAGALLFEMATGRPPFFGPAGEVRHAHGSLRPPRPSTLAPVPAAVEVVLLRCLAKLPADRFATAAELRQALATALAEPTQLPTGPFREPPVATATPGSSRRKVAVLYMESTLDPVAVQAVASSFGGTVAHASGGRYAIVFDPAAGEHPVRLALRTAHGALARKVARRALVDLASVTALARPGGAPRYVAGAFAQRGSYPLDEDPPGVLATSRAVEALPGVQYSPVPGREGLALCIAEPVGAEPPTVVGGGDVPLVGRDGVLAELEVLARGAFGQDLGTVAVVLAEAGLGKSHLASVLAGRLRSLVPAPDVLNLRAREAADGAEGGAVGALLRRALDLPAGAAPPTDGGRAALFLALPPEIAEEAWPAVALALGWLAPGAPELQARAAAAGSLVALTVRALGTVLRRRATVRPLCVLVDDAHLAGGVALDALEFAALAEAGIPMFVCALARPEFAQTRPGWGERAGRSRRLELGPLPPDDAADLCRRLLAPADSVPARAVDHLVRRTQGVPLHLVELVRSLRRDGLVRRHAQGGGHFVATDELDAVPDVPVVEWLADRQLRGLPAELTPHAQLAALLGDAVAPAETAGVLGELVAAGLGSAFPLDGAVATRRLLALGLLSSHRRGRTGFKLPLVRDAVARSTPDQLRRAIHEAACRHLEDPRSGPDDERLPRLLRHAEAVGRREQAAALGLRLAEAARARHAYLDAESLFTRTLGLLSGSPSLERLAALRGRGLMRYRLDRHEDSVADLAQARATARALGDRDAEVDCLLDEATALDWMGDHASSRDRYRAASELARVPGPAQQARLELARGRSSYRAGQWADAATALTAAGGLAWEAGDEAYETLVVSLLLLGGILPHLGQPAEARSVLDRARELATARGDVLHLSAIHMNERNLFVARGDIGAALRSQEETVRMGRELGIAGNEFYGEYNMAELLLQSGDLPGAEVHLKRALDVEARHPEVSPSPGLAVLLDSRRLLLAGDLAAARQRLEGFRAGLARAGTLAWRGTLLDPANQVLADMVELATRDAGDGEWEALLARSARHSIEQEPIEVMEARGLAAMRAGRVALARRTLEEALDLAGRIPSVMGPRIRQALASLPGAPR